MANGFAALLVPCCEASGPAPELMLWLLPLLVYPSPNKPVAVDVGMLPPNIEGLVLLLLAGLIPAATDPACGGTLLLCCLDCCRLDLMRLPFSSTCGGPNTGARVDRAVLLSGAASIPSRASLV